MRCTNHSVTRLHRIARDSPLQLMGSPGAQPMHWQPEFPLSGSLPSILLPQACPATALTHAHNTGPYPSLSLTLPGSSRQCSGVTPSPLSLFFFQSTTIGPLGPAWTSSLGSVWTPTSAIMRHSQPWPQRVSHPHATVCIACSTRSPARNAWHDTRSLRLPRVCCPQPGTPPAAHVCNACATRGWACNVCSTRSISPHIGTRTLRLPRVWYPQPLPALCIDTCSLRLHRVLSCGTWLQRVQHPQTLACPVWTPAHGSRCLSFTQPWWSCSHWETACSALACKSAKSNGWVPPSAMAATCVSPANPCLPCVEHPQPWACTVCSTRSNCSQLAPARYVCLVCDTPVYNTCSPSLHSVTLCSSLTATCATPANSGLHRVNTRAWRDVETLALPLDLWCLPWTRLLARWTFGHWLLVVHLHPDGPTQWVVPPARSFAPLNFIHSWSEPASYLFYLRFGTFALLRQALWGVTFSFCAKLFLNLDTEEAQEPNLS